MRVICTSSFAPRTLGGLKGYSAGKLISILNAPLLYGALS